MPFLFFKSKWFSKERYPIASCVWKFSQSSIKEQKRKDRIQSLCHFWWFILSGHQLGIVVWSASTIPSDGNSSQPPHQVWVGLSISMPCPRPGIWGEHDVTTHDIPPHSRTAQWKERACDPRQVIFPALFLQVQSYKIMWSTVTTDPKGAVLGKKPRSDSTIQHESQWQGASETMPEP